jgi:hypothetical protein
VVCCQGLDAVEREEVAAIEPDDQPGGGEPQATGFSSVEEVLLRLLETAPPLSS